MSARRRGWCAAALLVLVSCCVLRAARAADKYTDENRPYEFGFTIDGEQHRHEKKDENGLIMGEFGFITADGVYHVTVYATDENGNFKILSMKNLRVKPFPTAGGPQSRALALPPSPSKSGPPVPKAPAAPQTGLAGLPEASPAKACSGCSIPTSTTPPPPQLTDIAVVSRDNEQFPPYPEQPFNTRGRQLGPGQNQASSSGSQFSNEQAQPEFSLDNRFGGSGSNQGLGGIHQPDAGKFGQQPGQDSPQGGQFDQQPGQFGQQPGQFGEQPGQFGQQPGQFGQQPGQFGQQPGQFGQQPGEFGQQPGAFGQRPGQFGQPPGQPGEQPSQFGQQPGQFSQQPDQQGPSKPRLISAQMQIVHGNTDINKLGPGERQGLPSGLDKDDMLTLLYTFNYTVGFHGHHEEGYTNGAKKGYYYVTGRNGIRTRIDYTADETGFHPKISNEVLDLLSDDVPKPETEKDEKYGLKGYEFKWLYYPPDI